MAQCVRCKEMISSVPYVIGGHNGLPSRYSGFYCSPNCVREQILPSWKRISSGPDWKTALELAIQESRSKPVQIPPAFKFIRETLINEKRSPVDIQQ